MLSYNVEEFRPSIYYFFIFILCY